MECAPSRTLSSVIILILCLKVVCCQNVIQTGRAPSSYVNKEVNKKDCTNAGSRTTNNQLMNALYTLAASNGVLPDVMPIFDITSAFNDNSRKRSLSEIIGPKSVESLLPTYPQGPATTSAFPTAQEPSSTLTLAPPSIGVPMGFTAQIVPEYTVCHTYNPVPIYPCSPLVSSYPVTVPPSTSYTQAMPVIQPQVAEQQLSSPQTSSGDSFESENPAANQNLDIAATVIDDNGRLPITLQINIPAPIVPEAKITVINTPTPVESSNDMFAFPPYPTPPIIMLRSKSRNKDWLPILLLALLDGGGWGGGGGCCCCPCNCGSNNIPIPYPIPIPTNNPIIQSS